MTDTAEQREHETPRERRRRQKLLHQTLLLLLRHMRGAKRTSREWVEPLVDSMHEGLTAYIEEFGAIHLLVDSDGFKDDEDKVLEYSPREDAALFQLFQFGVRQISFLPGLEREELFELMDVLSTDLSALDNQEEDVTTLLLGKDLIYIEFVVVETFTEADLVDEDGNPVGANRIAGDVAQVVAEAVRQTISEGGDTEHRGGGSISFWQADVAFFQEADVPSLMRALPRVASTEDEDAPADEEVTAYQEELVAALSKPMPWLSHASLLAMGRAQGRALERLAGILGGELMRVVDRHGLAAMAEVSNDVVRWLDKNSSGANPRSVVVGPLVYNDEIRKLALRTLDRSESAVAGVKDDVAATVALAAIAQTPRDELPWTLKRLCEMAAGPLKEGGITVAMGLPGAVVAGTPKLMELDGPTAWTMVRAVRHRPLDQEMEIFFQTALQHADVKVRVQALTWFATFGGDHALRVLASALRDPAPALRIAGLYLIVRVLDKRGLGLIKVWLESDAMDKLEYEERRQVALVVAEVGGAAGIEGFRAAASESNLLGRRKLDDQRAVAVAALGLLGDVEFGRELEKMSRSRFSLDRLKAELEHVLANFYEGTVPYESPVAQLAEQVRALGLVDQLEVKPVPRPALETNEQDLRTMHLNQPSRHQKYPQLSSAGHGPVSEDGETALAAVGPDVSGASDPGPTSPGPLAPEATDPRSLELEERTDPRALESPEERAPDPFDRTSMPELPSLDEPMEARPPEPPVEAPSAPAARPPPAEVAPEPDLAFAPTPEAGVAREVELPPASFETLGAAHGRQSRPMQPAPQPPAATSPDLAAADELAAALEREMADIGLTLDGAAPAGRARDPAPPAPPAFTPAFDGDVGDFDADEPETLPRAPGTRYTAQPARERVSIAPVHDPLAELAAAVDELEAVVSKREQALSAEDMIIAQMEAAAEARRRRREELARQQASPEQADPEPAPRRASVEASAPSAHETPTAPPPPSAHEAPTAPPPPPKPPVAGLFSERAAAEGGADDSAVAFAPTGLFEDSGFDMEPVRTTTPSDFDPFADLPEPDVPGGSEAPPPGDAVTRPPPGRAIAPPFGTGAQLEDELGDAVAATPPAGVDRVAPRRAAISPSFTPTGVTAPSPLKGGFRVSMTPIEPPPPEPEPEPVTRPPRPGIDPLGETGMLPAFDEELGLATPGPDPLAPDPLVADPLFGATQSPESIPVTAVPHEAVVIADRDGVSTARPGAPRDAIPTVRPVRPAAESADDGLDDLFERYSFDNLAPMPITNQRGDD